MMKDKQYGKLDLRKMDCMELMKEYPRTELLCSGEAVGLPPGIMGNSEVGHLNIGAGRTVYQNLLRIDNAITEGRFVRNETLNCIMSDVKDKQSALRRRSGQAME